MPVTVGLMFVSALLLINCNTPGSDAHQQPPSVSLELLKSIEVNGSIDQIENIMEGIRVVDSLQVAYGIDFRGRRVYKLSVADASVRYLTNRGRGPKEMVLPSQIALKSSREFFVYDTSMDLISKFVDDEIIEKFPGWLRHNIWLRHTYGYYLDGKLITAIEEPEAINAMNFSEARPIVIMDLDDQSVSLHGRLSPTIDKMDTEYKAPILALDESTSALYYVMGADHTIMRHNLITGDTDVASGFKHPKIRERSLEINQNMAPTWDSAKKIGMDVSAHLFIEIFETQNQRVLVSVWQNATEKFYETRDPKYNDYFGVVYDLPGLSNPRLLEIHAKPIGKYNDRLLIIENDDPLEYVIGVYDFVFGVHQTEFQKNTRQK